MKLTRTIAEHALAAYRDTHGRYWKRDLRHAWETGLYDAGDDSSTLQRIRNTFGPGFLCAIRIPLSPKCRHV